MDPNANVKEQREIARRLLLGEDNPNPDGDGVRLAELVIALDEWLHNGGALPAGWSLRR